MTVKRKKNMHSITESCSSSEFGEFGSVPPLWSGKVIVLHTLFLHQLLIEAHQSHCYCWVQYEK